MPRAEIESKVEDYLRNSQALSDYWQRPITPDQLQAEMERIASHTKQPGVLHELFAAMGNDPFVIAECLARPVLAERLITELNNEDRVKLTTIALRKQPLQSWLAKAEAQMPVTMAAESANYALPVISGQSDNWTPSVVCTDETWTPTSLTNAPAGRYYFTGVWTGSEMIVWGGYDRTSYFNTGGRYNPSTDSWVATSTTGAPDAREAHTAVWTGTEMIVWGGTAGQPTFFNTGGRYNPSTDSWTATSTTNAPDGRNSHTAVWTGSEMIVWGGYNGNIGLFNTGGRYNPNTNSWTATSTTDAPTARFDHTAVWTGSEMIVWGGQDFSSYLNTGERYNASTDSWTATTTTNAPDGRTNHTAVWTGSQMIVWGGYNGNIDVNTGGGYNPGTDSWTAISTTNAPSTRYAHTAVWTSSEMIVWGGFDLSSGNLNTGGRYNPSTDSWTATTATNAPDARFNHTAVWTGSEMIIWGGRYYSGGYQVLNTGGRYCAQSAPMAQSAFSRKTHGAAGTFDIPLPLTGNVGIECRSGGATNDYQMIINFATTVTVGSASVTSGTGSVSSFTVGGPQVTVNLTGATNIQRITITLFNVNDGTHMGNVPISMGVLVGDVNGNAAVNATDVAQTKSQVGQPVGGLNFREDVNANGLINSADVALVKSKVGTALPP